MARRAKASTPEGAVLKSALELFRMHRWPAFRINSGSLRDREGRPVVFVRGADNKPFHGLSDINAIVPTSGRWLACEVKRPGGKPTPHQIAFLELVRLNRGVALLIDDALALHRALLALEADPWASLSLDGTPIPAANGDPR